MEIFPGAPIAEMTGKQKRNCHIMRLHTSHDRKILSVQRFRDGFLPGEEPYMIRRSRGYAPLPYMLSKAWQGQVLAVGGELKNACCIGHDDRFYPAPYVGRSGRSSDGESDFRKTYRRG